MLLFAHNVYAATDWTANGNAVLAWLMENTNTPTDDDTGNGNTGTITGPTQTTSNSPAAYSSGRYSFDGTNDEINGGDIPAIDDATTLSICMWFYMDNTTADHVLVATRNASRGILFFFDDVGVGTNHYRAYIQDNVGSLASLTTATNSAVATTWQHVAFTFVTGSSTGLNVYIDGVADPTPVSTTALVDAGAQNNNFLAGEDNSGSRDHAGDIDDIFAINQVLTSTDINEIMDYGVDGSGDVVASTGMPPSRRANIIF